MQIPGIRHRAHLSEDGITRRDLETWKRSEAITSIQPWYVTPEAPSDLVALLRLGVRPTCLDAAALHGLWVPTHEGVHVFSPRRHRRQGLLDSARAAQIRRRDGRPGATGPAQLLVLHSPQLRSWPDQDPVPDLDLLLPHAGRCLPTVKAAILLESAVNTGALTFTHAQRIVASLPVGVRRPLSRIRRGAESGTETAVRWWFESRGVAVRTQVPFPGGTPQRMDLLVGRSWVIECDSRAHHDDPRSYDEDRERDLYLRSWGYEVTRLSWEQVFQRSSRTEARLEQILRSGRHLRAPVDTGRTGRPPRLARYS